MVDHTRTKLGGVPAAALELVCKTCVSSQTLCGCILKIMAKQHHSKRALLKCPIQTDDILSVNLVPDRLGGRRAHQVRYPLRFRRFSYCTLASIGSKAQFGLASYRSFLLHSTVACMSVPSPVRVLWPPKRLPCGVPMDNKLQQIPIHNSMFRPDKLGW